MVAVLSVEQLLEVLVFRRFYPSARGSTHGHDETGHGHKKLSKGNWFRAGSSGIVSLYGVDRLIISQVRVGRMGLQSWTPCRGTAAQ